MQKRVLVLSNMYPSAAHPTYGQFVRQCVLALSAAQVHTEVVGLTERSNLFAKALAYVAFAYRANLQILSRTYDCIYIHHPLHTLLVCLPALTLRRGRFALNFHGHDLLPVKARGVLLQRLLSWKFKQAAVVIVPSHYFKRIFDTRFSSAKGERTVVFRSGGVNRAYFAATGNAVGRARTALFLSRLVRGKGWEAFLQTARKLREQYPDFTFTVAGVGTDSAAVLATTAALGLQNCVTVTEAKCVSQNLRLFQSHRYFIFPSRFDESLALVNLEAMACGCIVISTDFPTATEYNTHGVDGFVIPKEHFPDRCAWEIARLEANEAEMCRISASAAVAARRYHQDSVMGELPHILGLLPS